MTPEPVAEPRSARASAAASRPYAGSGASEGANAASELASGFARSGDRGEGHPFAHALGKRRLTRVRLQSAEPIVQQLLQVGGVLEGVGDDAPVGERHRCGGQPADLCDQRRRGERPLAVQFREPLQGGLVVLGGIDE